jgi:hypothetical protein
MVRGAKLVLLLIAAVHLAGCKTTAKSEQPVVRSSGETAPADLQLACAGEAATRLNGGNSVLPVSSVRDPSGLYSVGLQLSAGQAVCVIDQNGVIQSLGPA